ncbi:HAD family hydrolase [Williamwhitmania taraxaci]|uniref:Cof subfamily of IIB subfamily of haloacid dehalogenase superfamily/HAD-superfamily hydrolase, subfamily IIB n=1 Tax=Williamwhitmania taraxaci TaxID=1640674 RepID=A0A1G6RBD2_9BACT|nr:HAD family hydrolase [Williamwhitmania taraxaci]SDD01838.1 hypothetical protein SAMN05216323_10727 [Williamwhitmania taraxaci]
MNPIINYRIIFSDIDGTILNEQKDISEQTIAVAHQLFEQKNIPTVLISARMPAAIKHLSEKLCPSAPLIAYNGALIIQHTNGENIILHSKTFPSEVARYAIEQSLTEGFHVGLYYQDRWIVNGNDSWTQHEIYSTKIHPEIIDGNTMLSLIDSEVPNLQKLMVMAPSVTIDKFAKLITEKFSDVATVYRSADTYLEVTPSGCDKRQGVETLLANLAIEPFQAIAFGDNYNDLEMIKFVGMGVAVENARETVKAAANMMTGQGTKDGVAKALKHIFEL